MLYLCATPIGNLEDITLRVLRVLQEVSVIYCEDTRHSRILLRHFNIDKPLIACHEHNEAEKAIEICERVLSGESVAYLSDAGMPCISDPGARIVRTAIEMNVPYTVLPGATAFATALAISGYDSDTFAFYGFLERSGKQRKTVLERIIQSDITSIIYESPNRIAATLADITEYDSQRRVCIVREITKMYEQRIEGEAKELINRIEQYGIKGECVLIIDKKAEVKAEYSQIESRAKALRKEYSTKEAAEILSFEFGISKNEAKKILLSLIDK